jgi:hypothetical protein
VRYRNWLRFVCKLIGHGKTVIEVGLIGNGLNVDVGKIHYCNRCKQILKEVKND